MLLIASPLTRSLAIAGTLTFGTGCGGQGPSVDECTQWQVECVDECTSINFEACLWACEAEHDDCLNEAAHASEREERNAEALADAGVACLAVAACTIEALGDGDGDGDDDDDDWIEPEPESDDWGEDWGEQTPTDPSELAAPDEADLPADEDEHGPRR